MVKSTRDRKTTMILILFVTIIQTAEGGRLNCNPEQFAERGKPFVLTCNATHSVTDVYWYKGEDISDFPILVYENGTQRGKEYQRGEYELTSKFSLKIIDTQVKHEGSYTVRTYFQDYLYEDVTTSIRVYDLPSPSCPYVDACGLSCNGCAINMTTSGYLVCYVNGSRPKFDIDWSVDKFVGISSAMQQQLEIYNETSDTWYTKRNISYNIDRCGTNATFHCTVNAPVFWTANILETYSISVQIISEDCKAPISMEGTSHGKSNLLVICLSLIGGALLLLGMSFFVRYRIEKGKKKMLITDLLTAYETFYLVKPIPWEEYVSISKLYAAPKCTVTDANTSIKQTVSSKLLKEDFISENPRILLVAGMGHGKMSFTKYFVDKWRLSQQNENDETRVNKFILIHVSLKDVKTNELLQDVIKDKLVKNCKLTSRYIDKVLHAYKCVVIFSGLDEMSTSIRPVCQENYDDETVELATGSNNDEGNEADRLTNMVGEDDRSKLTIGNILRNTYDKSKYKNMNVWVTTSNTNCLKFAFRTPYCKVTFNALTAEDIKLYIHNTCKHYLESGGRGEELANLEENVARLIEMNEIVQNFFQTPLLRLMIIHITTQKLVNVEKYKDVDLNKITTVPKLVMRCLESRYKENFRKTQTDIDSVEKNLGKLAFESLSKENTNWKQELGEEMTKAAIEIGFMKRSGILDGSLGKSLLESPFQDIAFSHAYVKEYLAAQYILENEQEWDRLDEWTMMSDDEGTNRFIQCMCGLNHPKVHHLLKGLLTKEDVWNMLIDCLYEINDPELKKSSIEEILKELKKKSHNWTETHIINIQYLARRYHKLALNDFCRICKENGIKLKLGFQEKCAIPFLNEVALPPLMSLVFTEMSFDEDQYVSVITSLTSASCTELWFVRCNTPKELSHDNKEKVNKMVERISMKIHLSEDMPPQETVIY